MSRRGENIRKRKDGRWEGRYCVPEMQSGRKVSHSVYAKTYNEVKEKLLFAKISAETIAEKSGCDTKIRFSAVAEEWLAATASSKKHSTYIKYCSIYEKHIKEHLGEFPLSELNEDILTELFHNIESEARSDSLQKSISCVLNQILSYSKSYYHVGLLRYSYSKRRSGNKPVEVLNQIEQSRLLQCLYNKTDIYKIGIIICISTGLRLGEICSLKWEDINLSGKVLYVNTTVQRIAVDGQDTKTILLEGAPKSIFSKREIPLSDEIVKLLIPYYNNAAARYVLNRNKPMEPRTYQNKFQRYLQAAGIEKKNFHILRHTFATNCISSGTDVKSLSEILGHSDVKITLNRYVHPTIETKRQYMNSLSVIYGHYLGQQCQ